MQRNLNSQECNIFQSPNIVSLCMDSYDMEKQCGRLYHQYTQTPIPFSTLLEAVKKMEEFYDALVFPQADTILRSFLIDRKEQERMIRESNGRLELPEYHKEDRKKVKSFEKVIEQRGKDATFVIRVKFRQHSSWQGEVTWVDGQKKEYFRSALELLKLIDSVIEKEDE